VLILREVLGFTAHEVAELLGASPASVNSALQRARKAIDERVPEPSQLATTRSLGDERVRAIVQRFVDACETGDVGAILAMLAEDARFEMPPYPTWCRGRAAIAGSWLMPGPPPTGVRYLPTCANGQPAVGAYALDPRARRIARQVHRPERRGARGRGQQGEREQRRHQRAAVSSSPRARRQSPSKESRNDGGDLLESRSGSGRQPPHGAD